ncbi:ubr1 ubiquitin ligase isoform X2 [Rhynchophorus ferrugineus]|uniref:ubr1 ubiquitin ligase isoform X2 n=2 Tax=Rhynchophorus ferrugineus TaxID=354439 RepID=UPI003FCEB8DF
MNYNQKRIPLLPLNLITQLENKLRQKMEESADVEMPQDFPTATAIASKWIEEFEKSKDISNVLNLHWNEWVPKIFNPPLNENSLHWLYSEDQAREVLFLPLEYFICKGDSEEALSQLIHANKHSSVCGRFFKHAEPTYSCRECGMDKTCVLCVDCFKNSPHRFHKYRMGMSGGGGCCDCGDLEAWKKDPFCSLHQVKEEGDTETLPQDLIDRTFTIFNTILWYGFDILTNEQSSSVNNELFDLDMYCTILYNDEVHTFEQVISTLTRVLKCHQRTSTEYVTNIDREGRAVVKCSSFQTCLETQLEIEKHTSRHGTRPLKVLVNHAYVITHQIFAMKLLAWLEKFLSNGKGFRAVFSNCMVRIPELAITPHRRCLLTEVMLHDASLWKSARTQWHKLLIAGMLLEYENKKTLAKVFTKNYCQIMKDFIRDDHDHSYSISSLSVQLYTVPTLAHHLIATDDVLFILLNTVLSEYRQKCNEQGKLAFERHDTFQVFKRTLVMHFDLKYLLSFIPETWTDDLRRHFLHGLTVMLDLLVMMQGMDSVTRQVGQHMEFEPEWESGFNLHIKLAASISHIIQWCATDKIVLVKAYRYILEALESNPCYDKNAALETRELVDHSTACLRYDVSLKPVSIHLPLTRLLSALHLHLEKYGLHFDCPSFQVPKPTPVQIIEPVLRTQVMIAQVHAGMWRRNGYALLNTLYFYHNVKCRTEMLDRDINLLQIGASLIESNEFLIHVLNKFNLINWALADFEINTLKSPEEDSMRQTINLVEEFLHLLIIIIGERHMPGVSHVTNKDRVKKDILHALCIKHFPHSELVKTVSDDLETDSDIVDDVIDEIAKFNEPLKSSNSKGTYELQPQYYDEFNVFFYHYTREEMSKAEVQQRKRRKDNGELECCPPPQLPKLCESFSLLVNLLQCDVMLHIINTVFERCLNLRARSFSENQLHRALHLVGYGLQEEQLGHYPFFKFVENATKFGIFESMEKLLKCPRVDAHKGLLQWALKKYHQLTNKDTDIHKDAGCSTDDVSEKQRRAKLAAERRAKILAQMAAQQRNFIKENADLFENTSMELPKNIEICDMEVTELQTVALGPNQSANMSVEQTYTCILCQEKERISTTGTTMVMAAFVQQATVLCKTKCTRIEQNNPLFLQSNRGPAPYTSTCGHVMHRDCWRKFFDNVMIREHRRPYRLRHPASFDVDKQEFLCPLCECLSNTVLPLVPPLNKLQPNMAKNNLSFSDFLLNIQRIISKKNKVCHGIFKCNLEGCENIHCQACVSATNGTSIEQDTMEECEMNCVLQSHQIFYTTPASKKDDDISEEFKELFVDNRIKISPILKEMLRIFAQVTYTRGLNVTPHPSDKRLTLMAWKSLSYTIESIEVVTSYQRKPLLGSLTSRQRDCLENFIKVIAILGSTWRKNMIIKSHALNLLSILFDHPNDGPSVLEFDSFSFLVSLTYSLPTLLVESSAPIPTGGVLEWHTFKLMFVVNTIKILLDLCPCDMTSPDGVRHKVIDSLLVSTGKWRQNICVNKVWDFIKERSRPFLRCCVLFYHYLTDVPAPSSLLEVDGDSFENMCAYLNLSTTPELIYNDQFVQKLISKWTHHEEVLKYMEQGPSGELSVIPQLQKLPSDYSDLINSVSTFCCPNSNEECRNPTMCLVCGAILCSQSYCCQAEYNKISVGACNYHASICGAGVGVFLRIRDCELLLLATPQRGCTLSPPYLDEHGETDQGLRRGNPLKLNEEKYKKLHMMWLNHSIHEEIARQIETSNHVVATPWNMY